jgi:four helix bundle protein
VTYKSFEELPVWCDAIELAARLFERITADHGRLPSGLRDQLERAAVSISNNIAEGFERGTNQELIAFLYIARGSAGEVRSMLRLLDRLGASGVGPSLSPGYRGAADSGNPGSAIGDLMSRSLSISRQLGAWIESLKDSDYKGTRYRNQAAREADERARRRDDMLNRIEQYRVEALNRTFAHRDPTPAEPSRDPASDS